MEKSMAAAVSQGPDWEVPKIYQANSVTLQTTNTAKKAAHNPAHTIIPTARTVMRLFTGTYNRIFPDKKTYTPLRLRRRNFLLALSATLLALLALILGLTIGLPTKHKDFNSDVPIPTGTTIYHGDLTYYTPGLGACGWTSSNSDDIVSISHSLFDSQSVGSDPNSNLLCGRMIRAERYDSRVSKNVSLDLKVVDRCVGCQPTDLDVSPGAFDQLADPALGRVHDMLWAWI